MGRDWPSSEIGLRRQGGWAYSAKVSGGVYAVSRARTAGLVGSVLVLLTWPSS